MDKNITVREFPVVYTGEVTVELRHGKRVYDVVKHHNSGTTEFFEYVLRVVAGSVEPENRPAYIYLMSGDSTIIPYGILYESASNVTSNLTSANIDFAFFIPEAVLPSSVTSISGFKIAALSSTGFENKIYAEVDFSSPISVAAGSNIYLKWTLQIGNGSDDTI